MSSCGANIFGAKSALLAAVVVGGDAGGGDGVGEGNGEGGGECFIGGGNAVGTPGGGGGGGECLIGGGSTTIAGGEGGLQRGVTSAHASGHELTSRRMRSAVSMPQPPARHAYPAQAAQL